MSIADKLTTIAENEAKVFNAGKQAEYDAFWDSFQDYGNRLNYDYTFGGDGWNDETFKPKYNIKPSWNTVGMFYQSEITDLEAALKRSGVILDLSNNGNYAQVFAYGKFTILPEIAISKSAFNLYETFANCVNLHTIRKLTFIEGNTIVATSTFNNCTALANIEFAGVVANDINLKDCPLTKASIESLINILSSTTTGKTVTFKQTAKEAAFTDDEWATLIATKSNWTISLV